MFHYHKPYDCSPIRLLSKRFFPYHQAQRYKLVEIKKLSKFALFLSTLSSNPDLGRLVKFIRLDLTADDTATEQDVAAIQESAATAFRSLVRLRTISLSGPERIWNLLLDQTVPISQDLRSVRLTTPGYTLQASALRRSRFTNLTRYPKLSTLSVSWSPRDDTIPNQSVTIASVPLGDLDPLEPAQNFPKLKYPRLATDFSKLSNPGDLLKSCSPRTLALHDYSTADSKISDLLETLKTAEKLRELRIGSIARPPEVPRYFATLRGLSHLHTLSLFANCILNRLEFYSILSTLPLVDLTFMCSPRLSGAGVRSLVEGHSRIATLRHLKLDHVNAKEGTFVRSRGETDWVLPVWMDRVSRGELEAVSAVGKCIGVEVTGTAFEAMEIEDRFEEIIASL